MSLGNGGGRAQSCTSRQRVGQTPDRSQGGGGQGRRSEPPEKACTLDIVTYIYKLRPNSSRVTDQHRPYGLWLVDNAVRWPSNDTHYPAAAGRGSTCGRVTGGSEGALAARRGTEGQPGKERDQRDGGTQTRHSLEHMFESGLDMSRRQARAVWRGNRKKRFGTPTETNLHRDIFCFMAKTWTGHNPRLGGRMGGVRGQK